MILSVLRNTKSNVKFWFIENFLSPSFLVSEPVGDSMDEIPNRVYRRNSFHILLKLMGSSTSL